MAPDLMSCSMPAGWRPRISARSSSSWSSSSASSGFAEAPEDFGRLHSMVSGVRKGDAGALSESLAAITAAEGWLDPDSASLQRARALFNAGRHLAIWPVLSARWESLLERTSSIPESRVELARIVAVAGLPDEARRALASFQADTADVGLLEKALLVASACDERAIEATVIERLKYVFPRSRALGQHLVGRCLQAGDYGALARFLSDDAAPVEPEERSYLADVAAHLGQPDYASATDALVTRYPDRAGAIRLLVVREAARRSDHDTVLELCASIAPETADGISATRFAIDVLESALMLACRGWIVRRSGPGPRSTGRVPREPSRHQPTRRAPPAGLLPGPLARGARHPRRCHLALLGYAAGVEARDRAARRRQDRR